MNLESIFSPKSVAVIGASTNPAKVGGRTLKFIGKSDFNGKIFPINPNYDEINGLSCYASIKDTPETPEQIIICVPAKHVYSTIKDAVEIGVKSAVIFSGGFAEEGEEGQDIQRKLIDTANKGNLTILGPNCMGVIYKKKYIATYTTILEENEPSNSPIAFVGQSGAIGAFSYVLGKQNNVDLGTLISTGNESMVEVGDVVSYLADDEDIKVIMVYLEGSRKGKNLEEGLRKAKNNGKVVLACKVGRTSEGERAAASHTANMVGSDEVYDALFEKYNIIRCDDIEEMINIASLVAKGINEIGKRVGIMSLSGGLGVMSTDKCVEFGFEVPVFEEETSKEIRAHIPFAGASNPLDPTAQGLDNPDLLEKLLITMMKDKNIDYALFNWGYFLLNEKRGPVFAEKVINTAKQSSKPIIVVGLVTEEIASKLQEHNIAVFPDLERALKALYKLKRNNTKGNLIYETEGNHLDKGYKVQIIDDRLNEKKSKDYLASFGLPVPDSRMVFSSTEAVQVADEIGYPVVLKIQGENILHKSDIGGVELNLKNSQEVERAYQRILTNVLAHVEQKEVDGILVESMENKSIIGESLVTVKVDKVFGPYIVVGTGGIFTELLKDYVLLLPPFNRNYLLDKLKDLKLYKMLDGYRGKPKGDIEALLSFLEKLGDISITIKDDINEIEMNPVAIYEEGNGVGILDALIEGKGRKEN